MTALRLRDRFLYRRRSTRCSRMLGADVAAEISTINLRYLAIAADLQFDRHRFAHFVRPKPNGSYGRRTAFDVIVKSRDFKPGRDGGAIRAGASLMPSPRAVIPITGFFGHFSFLTTPRITLARRNEGIREGAPRRRLISGSNHNVDGNSPRIRSLRVLSHSRGK